MPQELRYPLSLGSDPMTNYIKFTEFKRKSRKSTEEGDIINLYMPERLQNPNTIGWDSEKLGTIGGFVDNMINGGALSGGASGIGQHAINAGSIQTGVLLSGVAGKMMGSNVSGERLFSHTMKMIPNPFLTMIFRGVDFRTFEFNFKFYPHSKAEAQEIHRIIKSFRRAAYPTKPADNDPYFLRYPSEFEIEYQITDPMGIEGRWNRYLNKFKRSVIAAIDTDYTATGMFAVHRDGFPSVVSLNLRMTEIEIITSNDIENGY